MGESSQGYRVLIHLYVDDILPSRSEEMTAEYVQGKRNDPKTVP